MLHCEESIDLDAIPLPRFRFCDHGCQSCHLVGPEHMKDIKVIRARLCHLEKVTEVHSPMNRSWFNPCVGYVLQYVDLLKEFKDHVKSLKLDIDVHQDPKVVDGNVIYPSSWTHTAPLIVPRICFVVTPSNRFMNVHGELPLIMIKPSIYFPNEDLWKQRWLEKKAKKALLVREYFKPDFYQTILAENEACNGWLLKKSNRKYITIPCVFNDTLNLLGIMCFPYILFNSIADAKREATEWFFANPDAGDNFVGPIFELNTITGHVYLADQINLVKDRPNKRKKDDSMELTRKLKDKMETAVKKRFENLSLEELTHPLEDMDACEKTYDRGEPTVKRSRKDMFPPSEVYDACDPVTFSVNHPYDLDMAKLLQNFRVGMAAERKIEK